MTIQRNARQRRQTEADGDALQRRQHVPANAHIVWPVAIKRIGKQGHGRIERAERRRETFAVNRRQLPEHHQQTETEQRRDDAL